MVYDYGLWMDIRRRVSKVIPAAEHDLTMCFVYADRDPPASLAHARKALEAIVEHLGRSNTISLLGDNLSKDIRQLEAEGAIPARIRARMDAVRAFGNMASHHGSALDEQDSQRGAADLLFIAHWLVARPQSSPGDDEALSAPLAAGLQLLRKRIDVATDEQKSVLTALKKFRRVSISGCAGSGKTLLAMEKAARLDGAGLSVLFLCHNPHLAESISDTLIYTDVVVSTFIDFINTLTSHEGQPPEWNHYTEVSSKIIEAAFDDIINSGTKFDAVIVDEAQDFLEDWWILIEQLINHNTGFFYIFFDNSQALLPFRAKYPVTEHAHVLSTIVRNSSEIAQAIVKLNRVPITIKPELAGGTMVVRLFAKGEELIALTAAVSAISAAGLIAKSVVVATEVVDPRHSLLSDVAITLTPGWSWQNALREISPLLMRYTERTRAPSSPRFRLSFPELSDAPYPNQDDISAVSKWARSILSNVDPKVANAHGYARMNVFSNYIDFGSNTPAVAIARFLSTESWAEQLPAPLRVQLVAVGNSKRPGLSIPLHSAASIKGLEADGTVTYIPTVIADLRAHAYVAISRARLHHELVMLREVARHLPYL